MSGWLETYPGWSRQECGSCDGHGIYDRSYHDPDECRSCNGSGYIWRHDRTGSYAQWPGGPFLGRDLKSEREQLTT